LFTITLTMLPQRYRSRSRPRHAEHSRNHALLKATPMNPGEELPDFTRLDDTALLSTREQMRAELQRLSPHSAAHAALAARYDASLDELVERARNAWARSS
jgi:hypothetical protein